MVRTYPAGTPVATIVKDVFSAAGVPVGLIEDPGIALTKNDDFRRFTLSDSANLHRDVNGEIVKRRQILPDLLLLEGWTAYVRCLLQWKASQDSIIKLESNRASGLFKVVEFKHVCKRDEFYTELGVKAI